VTVQAGALMVRRRVGQTMGGLEGELAGQSDPVTGLAGCPTASGGGRMFSSVIVP
jgi:hypothetical protein